MNHHTPHIFRISLFPGLTQTQGTETDTDLGALAVTWANPRFFQQKRRVPFWSACLYRGSVRHGDNVLRLSGLVLDFEPYWPHADDDAAPSQAQRKERLAEPERWAYPQPDDVQAIWREHAHLLHTSYSHGVATETHPAGPCFRVFLPYSRPVTEAEHERIWAWAYERSPHPSKPDPKCKSAAQGYYQPGRNPLSPEPYLLRHHEGPVLDVDALLESLPEPAPPPPPPCSSRPPAGRLEQQHGPRSTVPLSHRQKAYADQAVAKLVQRILREPPGGRSDFLTREAFEIGGLVGAGVLHRDEVVGALWAAITAAGWKQPRKTRSTLERSIDDGARCPRTLPTFDAAPSSAPGAAPSSQAHAAAGDVQGDDEPEAGDGGGDDGNDDNGDDGGEPSEFDRPLIDLDLPPWKVIRRIDELLGERGEVFQRAGFLVTPWAEIIARRGKSPKYANPTIKDLSKERLHTTLGTLFRFEKTEKRTDDEGKPIWIKCEVNPTGALAASFWGQHDWKQVRPLRGIAESPVIREDGTVLETPGYDEDTALMYAPNATFPRVPDRPTKEDAQAAAARLFDLVRDFPFEQECHRSGWLASLLTPLARFTFEGPAPLFLFDANVRGAGKSLLADLVSVLITGERMGRMAYAKEDAEMDKRILSAGKMGHRLVLLDDINSSLGSPSLNNALTTTRYQGRLLGTNDMPTVTLSMTWYGSGNNVQVDRDTERRIQPVRLKSPEAQPENRKGFKNPRLLDYASKHRASLLVDALTILRAWYCDGKPEADLPTWGSYEGWTSVVRQAIVWLGQADPADARDDFRKMADTEGEVLAGLVRGWAALEKVQREAHRETAAPEGLSASQVLATLERYPDEYADLREAILQLCPSPAGKLPSGHMLGRRLAHLRDRVVDGRCLTRSSQSNSGVRWTVKEAPRAGGDKPDGGGDKPDGGMPSPGAPPPEAPPPPPPAPAPPPAWEGSYHEGLPRVARPAPAPVRQPDGGSDDGPTDDGPELDDGGDDPPMPGFSLEPVDEVDQAELEAIAYYNRKG